MAINSKSRPYTMIDLFAGCGGVSYGLEQAGFVPIFVNELNNDARASYLANRSFELAGMPFNKRENLHSSDIYELTKNRLAQLKSDLQSLDLLQEEGDNTSLDLICGGPPCQGYSGIGHRRSYSVDKRDLPSNQLYEKMAEVIEFFRPKIFLFENVKGLLSSKWTSKGSKGEIWKDVHQRFANIAGYSANWQLVRAKDYGVPQNRPRILLVGIRQDILKSKPELTSESFEQPRAVECGFLPPPTNDYPHPKELLSDLVDKRIEKHLLHGDYPKNFETKSYPRSAKTEIQKRLRRSQDGTEGGAKGALAEQVYSKHSAKVVAKFKAMHESGGKIPAEFKTKKFAQRLLKERWPTEGPNITATSLPDDYVHYAQPRSLTVREWARLQMFPDCYVFKGKRTTGGTRRAGNPQLGEFERDVPKYTQIGNAVPTELARKTGIHFKKILEDK